MGRYNNLYRKQDLSLSPYINSYLSELGNSASTSGVNNENWVTTSDTPNGILNDLKDYDHPIKSLNCGIINQNVGDNEYYWEIGDIENEEEN